MARLNTRLNVLVHADHEWLRCNECSGAFWGAANATALVVAKAERHALKAHNRGQRRAERRGAGLPEGAFVLESAVAGMLGKRLGRGVMRVGYELGGGLMLKLALHDDGKAGNLAEWRAYHSAPADKREWLCPVVRVAADGAWLIMRMADDCGNVNWHDQDRIQAALGAFVADLHGGNIGYVDGHPVATDYAGGMRAHEVDWARGR